jgi:hypothetical protein
LKLRGAGWWASDRPTVEACGRRSGEILIIVLSAIPEREETPGEHPAHAMLITCADVRDSPEGQNPRNRGLPGPAILLRREGITGRRNGMWVRRRGNAVDTFCEEKAPKGEAQERRRCEIKPARARREEAVKRVAKP